jgi:mRNA interferase HigB
MRLISNRFLTSFAGKHPAATLPLQAWRKLIEAGKYADFAALKNTFNSVDKVGMFYVFNVGGNKFRVVTAIHFNTQAVYVREVFTHKEYDKWKP